MTNKSTASTQGISIQDRIKFKNLLLETREKRKHWYISVDEFNVVEYTLQSNDEQKIRLVHRFKPESYHFINFTGVYTYEYYRALENAILDIVRFKTTLPKGREKGENKQPSVQSETKKWKDVVFDDLQEKTRNGICKWTDTKDSKRVGVFTTVYNDWQMVFTVSQINGPKAFEYCTE